MTNLYYFSGDAVQIGDEVECDDGVIGKVTMIIQDSRIPGLFNVKKIDGIYVDYQSLNPHVRLINRQKRATSPTMGVRIKKVEFLGLLNDLGSHSLYYAEPLSKRLAECGLSATIPTDGQGLIIEGQLIAHTTPEWGSPGISTLSILSTIYELATGEKPLSNMTGRGFWYRDVMTQLADFWGIKTKYT